MSPPWGSKYTININTEMNYWPALSTNLAETMDPLTAMVSDLSVTGARTAREMYGAGGWVAHHNTDLWRATGPIDGPQYGMWPTGGAWLTLPLWDRYRVHRRSRLPAAHLPAAQRRGAVLPRHARRGADAPLARHLAVAVAGEPASVRHVADDGADDGRGDPARAVRQRHRGGAHARDRRGLCSRRGRATRARLAPHQIGSAGQLQEWLEDWDMQAPEIHHRHVSHLFGLFPGHDIDVRRTPELAAAVKRSLEIRGDQATGWATAWRINLWAQARRRQPRLRDPEVPARPRAHVPQHVRRAPAVSDRRQLRRHVGHRRDAAAVRRGRDSPVAGASRGVAGRSRHRAESARRIRDRSDLEARRARARDDSFAARTAAARAPGTRCAPSTPVPAQR